MINFRKSVLLAIALAVSLLNGACSHGTDRYSASEQFRSVVDELKYGSAGPPVQMDPRTPADWQVDFYVDQLRGYAALNYVIPNETIQRSSPEMDAALAVKYRMEGSSNDKRADGNENPSGEFTILPVRSNGSAWDGGGSGLVVMNMRIGTYTPLDSLPAPQQAGEYDAPDGGTIYIVDEDNMLRRVWVSYEYQRAMEKRRQFRRPVDTCLDGFTPRFSTVKGTINKKYGAYGRKEPACFLKRGVMVLY